MRAGRRRLAVAGGARHLRSCYPPLVEMSLPVLPLLTTHERRDGTRRAGGGLQEVSLVIMRPVKFCMHAFGAFFIFFPSRKTHEVDGRNHEDRHRRVERRPTGGGASTISQQRIYWLCGGILSPSFGIAGGIFSLHSLWSSRRWWLVVVLRNFNNDIEQQQQSQSPRESQQTSPSH